MSAVHIFTTLYLSLFPRQQLSKAHFDSPPISPKTPGSAVKCKTPREKDQKSNSVFSNFFQKRPKTSPPKETQQDGCFSQRGKTQTARSHTTNGADLHSSTTQLKVAVKEEPMDDGENGFRQSLKSIKQEDTVSYSNTGAEMAHSSSPPMDVKPVIKGEAFLLPTE